MEFITKLFPKEGFFAATDGEQFLYIQAGLIWVIITYWLAKPVLGRAFKGLSAGFKGKLAKEEELLAQLTAEPINRKGGFIQENESFAALEHTDFVQDRHSIIRKHFETCSYTTATNVSPIEPDPQNL